MTHMEPFTRSFDPLPSWLLTGAGEPGTPGKGSERPVNDDQPLKPGDKVEKIERQKDRPRPESPGGAGDMRRVE